MTSSLPVLTQQQRTLLECLAHTPFLRAEDLALEVGLQLPQTYAHLRTCTQHGLLESVSRPSWQRGACRLYVLTPAGRKACTPGDHSVALSGKHLFSLLPRLDRLMLGHTLIHELIVQAPAFFGQGGKTATVQWAWIRDYQESLPALPQRPFAQPARFQADWFLRLQITMPGEHQRHYYPLFLVVDHECLPQHHIRRQIQTFLHARQVATDRYLFARDAFPPLLILLPSWHRARHWQRWEAELTGGGRSPVIRGGLAVMTDPARGSRTSRSSPWRWPWQAFHRYGPASLRELLRPVPEHVLPRGWRLSSYHSLLGDGTSGKEWSASAARWSRVTMKQLQARQVGQWTRQARDRPPTQLASSTALALLGLRLSRHQYRLLELLLSHPLLSSTNLAALLSVQESSVRQYLSEMRSLYCLETEYLAADATTPRWRLSSHGLRLLALRYRLSLRAIATRHEEYEHPYPVYVQKGLEHLRRNAAHTIGVYAFFTRLATDAASPQHRLLWWETGYAREQAYYAFSRPAWTWEKPHGIGEYQIGTQRVRFWFEWQDSWNSWQYIQSLLTGYATYIRSAEWRREGYVLPVLLLVCPDGVRERHMQQIVRDALGLLHPTPLILTTTVEMFNTCGPLAAIWQLVSFMSKDASTPIRRVFYDMSMEGNIRPPLDRGG